MADLASKRAQTGRVLEAAVHPTLAAAKGGGYGRTEPKSIGAHAAAGTAFILLRRLAEPPLEPARRESALLAAKPPRGHGEVSARNQDQEERSPVLPRNPEHVRLAAVVDVSTGDEQEVGKAVDVLKSGPADLLARQR